MGKDENKLYLAALISVPLINSKNCARLLHWFGSPRAAWEAKETELKFFFEGKTEAVEQFIKYRKINTPEKLWARLEKENICVASVEDETYPNMLKTIQDPPPVLFWRGNYLSNEKAIAIVGSRKATHYGKHVAETLARGLSVEGFLIVSGMARGIDTSAHLGALATDGLTTAVLGCGLDIVYPPENRELMERIQKQGAVVSEFPLGTRPESKNFPARNRIISGLSLGVVVVEAAEKSGALITVDYALDQGRDVFAVPGPITSPNSAGTNQLIKQGAKLVSCVQDIVEEYGVPAQVAFKWGDENSLEGLTPDEQIVLEALGSTPVHGDFLVQSLAIQASVIQGILLHLELKGLIRQLPGKHFVKSY
ncbi:MAG: DNA-processing protein DprA [Bacillota bacterium]